MKSRKPKTTNNNDIKARQNHREKKFIDIIGHPDMNSPALPGNPLTPKQFKDLILSRENGPTISLKEFIANWQLGLLL